MITLSSSSEAVGEIFNVGNDEEISIMDLAKRVKKITESRSEIVKIPYSEAYGEGFEDMSRRAPDLSKLKAAIGYEPSVDLDQTIRQIVELSSSWRNVVFPAGRSG